MTPHSFLVTVDLEECLEPAKIALALADTLSCSESIGKVDVEYQGSLERLEEEGRTVDDPDQRRG